MRIGIFKGKFWDLLFALGIIFTTMTTLRLPGLPIGLGEILLVLWMLKQWITPMKKGSIRINKNNKDILLFWILFFIILSFGMIISSFRGRLILKSALYDLGAYLFSFILCLTLSLKNEEESLYKKMEFIVILGTIIFSFLLFWWKNIGANFLGMELVYGNIRFTGGAKNPNQLALFLVPIPALSLYITNNKTSKLFSVKHIFLICIFFASLYAGLNTRSDSFNGTLILTLIFVVILYIYKKLKFPLNIMVIVIASILILSIILFNTDILERIYQKLISIFNELDSDRSRTFLWVQGIKTAFVSPLVGYGPGSRVVLSPTYIVEAHNTFIDLMIQAGLIGLFLYNMLLIKLTKTLKYNIYLITALFSLIVYSVSHFVLRQPIFWVYMILLLGAISFE